MVGRAFRLLDLLSVSEEGLTLSDLARALGMSKSSVHGLLKTLESNRAVEQSEERRYVLGPHIFDLAQAYGQRPDLRRVALPAMRRLADSIGQTIFLGRVEQDRVRILECLEDESERPSFCVSGRRGARLPLMAGALARVVLASWPVAKREAFLRTNPLLRFNERSITDPAQFLAAVEEAARTGIGEDHEEYLTGMNAVAAPIYGSGGALIALLWVAGFAASFGDEAMRHAGQQLRSEADAISQALGAR
jgi:DNA-binding IclR family transcriptional regulator